MLPSSSLTVPDVQISRFRFFMEEFCSRRCSDGRSGLPAEGDAVGVQRTGSWGAAEQASDGVPAHKNDDREACASHGLEHKRLVRLRGGELRWRHR
jgi:hypothetical protein